jgi:hypothetical protein
MFLRFLMIFRSRCCNPRTTFTAGSLEFFGNDPRKNAIKAMRSLVACTSPAAAKLAADVDGLGRRGAFRASPDLAQGLQGGGRVGGGRAGRRRWAGPGPAAGVGGVRCRRLLAARRWVGGVEGGLGKGRAVRVVLVWRGGRGSATASALAAGGTALRFDAWPCEALPEMDEGHDGYTFTHGPAGWHLLHAQASAAWRTAARGLARPVARPSGVPGHGVRCGERGGGSTAALGPPRGTPGVRTPGLLADATRPRGWARARLRQSAARTPSAPCFISFARLQKCITP